MADIVNTTEFKIWDVSAAEWKRVTALKLKDDDAAIAVDDQLLVHNGTEWRKADPTGFKALTQATEHVLAHDGVGWKKATGVQVESYFGGGGPVIPPNTFSYTIDTEDNTWEMWTNAACTVDVDWGDGSSEQLVLPASEVGTTHTYPAPGQYTVVLTLISGAFLPRHYFRSEKDIVAINGTGEGWVFSSLDSAWRAESSITFISPDLDTSYITNMQAAFLQVGNVTVFPPLDTSSVTAFASAFQGMSGLTEFPVIDVSSATGLNSLAYTWSGCTGLTSFPSIDLSAVTGLNSTWSYCSGLTSFPYLDITNVTFFSNAWANCPGLNSSNWPYTNADFVQATNLGNGFASMTGFDSPPITELPNATNLENAWRYNTFVHFPIVSAPKATNWRRAWQNCESLVSFAAMEGPLVTRADEAWYRCYDLTTFPLLDLPSCTNFSLAWGSCSLTPESIENITQMLINNGSTNLTTQINGANYEDWTAQAQADYLELTNNRGWTIIVSGTPPA